MIFLCSWDTLNIAQSLHDNWTAARATWLADFMSEIQKSIRIDLNILQGRDLNLNLKKST